MGEFLAWTVGWALVLEYAIAASAVSVGWSGYFTGTILNDDLPPQANVFINEINYDPDGNDTGEFIEIAGLAGTDLSGWSIVLYNGNGGASYNTQVLSGVLGDGANGFGFDPVMYIPELGQTFAQMAPEEKNARSHRGQAARRMIELIRESWL